MKIYTLEISDICGEDHYTVGRFATPEARERFLADRSLVVSEFISDYDIDGCLIEQGWLAWHTEASSVELKEYEETPEKAIDTCLRMLHHECYQMEYEVIE